MVRLAMTGRMPGAGLVRPTDGPDPVRTRPGPGPVGGASRACGGGRRPPACSARWPSQITTAPKVSPPATHGADDPGQQRRRGRRAGQVRDDEDDDGHRDGRR